MTTVGQILLASRNHKKLTLDQVEKATKIRQKFLVALEADDFDKLPPGTIAKGFIKNYCAYLGIPIEETLAFYRRQVNEDKTLVLPTQPVSKTRFAFSATAIGVAVLVLLFFIYITYSFFRYAGSPTLTLSSPPANSVVQNDQINVVGKTDPDAILTINNQQVFVNENGSFDAKINLTPGLNTITIIASNKFHRQSTLSRNLRLEQ